VRTGYLAYLQPALGAAARASGIDPEEAADRIRAEAKKLRDQGRHGAAR
jgi:hypothetical protein